MVTAKLKFKTSKKEPGEGTVYIWLTCKRQVRLLPTGVSIRADEWDKAKSRLKINGSGESVKRLITKREELKRALARINRIIRKQEKNGMEYDANDIVFEYKRYMTDTTLFGMMEKSILRLEQTGRIRTSETYRSTLCSFRKFRNGKDLMLDSLTSDHIEDYEAWLKSRQIRPNTSSFYMRILRAVYNRAVENGVMENLFPFRRVYTGVDKTVKRALPLSALKKILLLDLKGVPQEVFARDMFMMSFYLRGMSFVDMAFLRKGDLQHGYVIYRRRKTGQLLAVKWTQEMQQILDKYAPNESQYLLPIITSESEHPFHIYRKKGYLINYHLKRIGEKIRLEIPLTLYVARHSWASIAKSKGISIGVISEGMGHRSEKTTRIYLSELDTSLVDAANSLIIKSL